MGKKGITSADIEKQTSTFIVVQKTVGTVDDLITQIKSHITALKEADMADLDDQTKEALEQYVATVTATYNVAIEKNRKITEAINRVIGVLHDTERKAQASMSKSTEDASKVRSKIQMSGKR